jgi:hypothetical protein
LVSTRTHTQLEEVDPENQGAEAEGRSDREVERLALQHYSASNDDMDLLNNDESPLIKDVPLSPTSTDINMVFTLPTEFRGVEEEIVQLCLGPKEVMFKKTEESSQCLKPLYIRGRIDPRPISRMLVNDGVAVYLMPYSMFKKLGRENDEVMRTNLTLNGV